MASSSALFLPKVFSLPCGPVRATFLQVYNNPNKKQRHAVPLLIILNTTVLISIPPTNEGSLTNQVVTDQ
jgi:hypothetical protein